MAGESKTSIIMAAAVAATGTLAAYASLSFAPGGLQAATTQGARSSPTHVISQSALATTVPDATVGQCALGSGLAAGLIAGAATAGRRAVARKIGGSPVAEYKEQAVWAGGLVGSEYGGYGRHEFDPAGLASRYSEHLPWYREAELKHGRVAMLGCLGLIVPDAVRIPLDLFESPDITFVNAHNKLIGPGLGEGPMWWLLIFCGVIESARFKQLGLGYENLTLENAGDIGFGKGFLPKDKEGIIAMQIKELKNGRLAMLGFSGAITQAVIYDSPHFPFVPN